ncbi:MAG TPA: FtsX-like permease family protein, partial [Armatimonadota bacterium]
TVPLNMPRFWISRQDAPALIALSRSPNPPSVTLHAAMAWEHRTANNILGQITGSDPELKKQIIVVQAYYDATSVVPGRAPGAESAGSINALLQLAKAYQQVKPKRTVWFLATNGHYQALGGIRYWLESNWKELEQNSTRQNLQNWLTTRMPGIFHYTKREPPQIYLFAGLDLSSQTKGLGVFYKGWYYDFREDLQSKFSDIARADRENAERISKALNLNFAERFADGVNPISGKSWRNFIPAKPAFDAEAVTMAGGKGITFASVDDGRMLVDTPLDTPDRVNVGNLAEQTKMLVCLLWHCANDPNGVGISEGTHLPITEPAAFGKLKLQGGFATIRGRVLMFDPRKSVVPNRPILGSVALLWKNDKSYMGVRGAQFELTTGQADYSFVGAPPVTAFGGKAETHIGAYKVDERTGDLIYAPDEGITGAKFNYQTRFQVTTGLKETGVVVFECNTTALYDLVDPQSLKTLPTVSVLDSVSNGEPRMYGFDMTKPERLVSHVEDVALIYAQPKGDQNPTSTRVKIIGQAGPGATRMVLIGFRPNEPEGVGYPLDGTALYNTSLLVAKDMHDLNEYRIAKLRRHRIINPAIDGLHESGRKEILAAEAAQKAKQWDEFDARSRAAWGYEARAYPNVLGTMNDVIKGVIFYLFLLMPFSFFTERLLVGATLLRNQVLWVVGIFVAIFIVFRYIHPAFDISMNPLLVLLAFVMLALSLFVISMLAGRFEKELKDLNKTISGVHRADIGRLSVAAAAFNLGISNMRRRKARTMLTCATLILLTFTVLSFTSVVPTIRFNRVPAAGAPPYQGLLLRTARWDPLEESAYRILKDEFGATRAVAARAWFFGTQLGEQSFITLKRGDKKFDARSIVGLTPEEDRISHFTDPAKGVMLGTSRWFLPGDTNVVIIPKGIADALNIPLEQIGKATLSFSGVDFRVIGMYDKDKFKAVTDLDTEPLSPVDFLQMNRLQSQGRAGSSSGENEGFQEYLHLEPDQTFLVPYDTLLNMGGEVRSVAMNFATSQEVEKVLKDLMPRIGLNLYGGQGNQTFRFSTIGSSSAKGGADIFIPILIASLIVLNTMLGSVYERVKEIGIFSSIGLAPGHIAALFIGEAMVYANLGAVAGYIMGQLASKVIGLFPAFTGLYLNFSSMSAVLTTLIVVTVVLLSTLYPARKASEVATPAIERSWRVPDPVGDLWKIDMPFAVTGMQASALNGFLSEWFLAYEEYSIGDFVTQGVETAEETYEHGGGYKITLTAWLAPFDLGVSQFVTLETVPTAMEDVFELKLTFERKSGDVSNWKRINRRFLNTMRKQFLIWRTLRAEERERYLVAAEAAAAPASA